MHFHKYRAFFSILTIAFASITSSLASAENLKVNGEFNLAYNSVYKVPGWIYNNNHVGKKDFFQVKGYNWLTVYSHDLLKDIANWCAPDTEYNCRKSEISFKPGELNHTQKNGWDGNWKIGTSYSPKMWLAYGFKIRNLFDSDECYPNPTDCYVYISQFHTRGGTDEEYALVSPIQGIKLTNGSNGTYKISADTKVCVYDSKGKCIGNNRVDFLDGVSAVDGVEPHILYTVKMEIDWHTSNGQVTAWIKGGNGSLKYWTKFAHKSGVQTNPGDNQKNFQFGMYWGGLNANYFPPHTTNVMEIDFDSVWVTEKSSDLPQNWQ